MRFLLQLGTNDAIPLLEKRWEAAEFRGTNESSILVEFKKCPGPKKAAARAFSGHRPSLLRSAESAAKNRIVETVINPLIRDVAKGPEGAVLVDNAAVLSHRPELYDPDCVHPAPEGRRPLALSWAGRLRPGFPRRNRQTPRSPRRPPMTLLELLQRLVQLKARNLHLMAGLFPAIRIKVKSSAPGRPGAIDPGGGPVPGLQHSVRGERQS